MPSGHLDKISHCVAQRTTHYYAAEPSPNQGLLKKYFVIISNDGGKKEMEEHTFRGTPHEI